jgi:hypothetical protein
MIVQVVNEQQNGVQVLNEQRNEVQGANEQRNECSCDARAAELVFKW